MAMHDKEVRRLAEERIKAQEAKEEDEETIEERNDDDILIEPLDEEEMKKESPEEFEKRVQEEMERTRQMMEDERSGKAATDRVKHHWKLLAGNRSKEQRRQQAKVFVSFLLKKYPQLMDEGA